MKTVNNKARVVTTNREINIPSIHCKFVDCEFRNTIEMNENKVVDNLKIDILNEQEKRMVTKLCQ